MSVQIDNHSILYPSSPDKELYEQRDIRVRAESATAIRAAVVEPTAHVDRPAAV